MRTMYKNEKMLKTKRIAADFSFHVLDVWGGAYESYRRLFRLEVGFNFMKKSKIR